jgi:hypothetical protein
MIWRKINMKKLFAALLTALLIFSPVGSTVFQDSVTTVEAKGYKSGKKSFNSNTNTNNNNNTLFQNKKDTTTKSTTTPTKAFKPGGFMKGLMIGGLAGLLFGSLFANMGMLGSILGLMINVLAIFVLISVIRKIFIYFKNKRKEADANSWRN